MKHPQPAPAPSHTAAHPPRQGMYMQDQRQVAQRQQALQAQIQQRAELSPQAAQHARIQESVQGAVIQGYFIGKARRGFLMAQEKRATNLGHSFLSKSGKSGNIKVRSKGSMRIADDGNMAVEDGGGSRQAKTFYASQSVVNASNNKLKSIGSPVRLAVNPGLRYTTNGSQGTKNLSLAYPYDLRARTAGHNMKTPQRCNEAAPYLANTENDRMLRPVFRQGHGHKLPQNRLMSSVDTHLAALLPLLLKKKNFMAHGAIGAFFKSLPPWWHNFLPELQEVENLKPHELSDYLEEKGGGKRNGMNQQDVNKGTDHIVKRYVTEFLQARGSDSMLKEIGLNAHAKAHVGDVLSIRTLGTAVHHPNGSWTVRDHRTGQTLNNPFQYHFATVVARSGSDYMTLENYARQGEEGNPDHPVRDLDPRYFFQMHGSEHQSFHSENEKDYANPMTLSFSPDRDEKDHGRELDSAEAQEDIRRYNLHLNRLK